MIYINGRFLTQKITGVQRYAIEVVKKIDKLNLDEQIVILHPKNFTNHLELKNIKLQQIGNNIGHVWEQITLPFYIRKHDKKAVLINFCNIAPILFPGYVVLHDIAFKTHPEHLNWKFTLWYRIITKLNIKRYKHIFTVSEFSKNEILQNYKIEKEKITVAYNSAEHINYFVPDDNVLDKLKLVNKDFYFSLGSKSPHKNFEFIEKCAKDNPEMIFVVSGNENKIFKENDQEKIENLIFTGYITDNELVQLYKSCKCFIFPSLYEGFGIPPLEAITVGCNNILVSDILVLKEIYGNNVKYINTQEYIKEDLLKTIDKEMNIDKNFLKKYSWNATTKKILNYITRKV